MEEHVAQLSIEDEEEELVFEGLTDVVEPETYELCVVGLLLTDKRFNFPVFQSTMVGIWRPGRKMEIEDLGNKLILFRFNHITELRRVVDSGPWTFDQSMLIMRELKAGETPMMVELCYVDFWVRVGDLPVGLFSLTVGKALGDFVGKFLEFEVNNVYTGPESYMRIRVRVDVRKPLRREKKVRKVGGEALMCKFQYERLGHTDKFCEVLFRVPENQIIQLWDKSLRAPPSKAKHREGDR
ncbi:hypothetical protein LINPERHAP1_LOCUS21380 [Linum perenne]